MANLRITLLGRFFVGSGAGHLQLHAGTAHLLAYLALSCGRLIPRTRIAGALWPDLPEARAKANLSTSAWRLRQSLSIQEVSSDLVRASDYDIGLDTSFCEVDVDAFRRDSVAPGASATTLDSLARAAYAAGLYKGDLLEDWDLEWCRTEKEHLRRRFVHTLRALAEGFERLARYDLALQYATRAAEADPSDEPVQRSLIRLLLRNGDRTSAASQFRRFLDYARLELGVEPDAQTLALLGQIRTTSSEHSSEVDFRSIRPGMIPFVGRTEERQQIAVLLEAAMAGSGSSLLILGEAGVGKSRLADWALAEWAARGGLTARGRCIEFNDPIPYQPIVDAIGSVADITGITSFATPDFGGLPSVFPEASAVRSANMKSDAPWPAAKLRLFGWLLGRLEKASRRRPLIVVIEDLQWAHSSSMDFLAYLIERARNMRFLVLVTARPSIRGIDHDGGIERISRHCTTTIRLGPLTPVETVELVQVLLETTRITPHLGKLICRETEGNPLFIVETIRLLQQKGKLSGNSVSVHTADNPVWPAASIEIPDGVRSAVEQRLQLIDSGGLRVAQIASVLGRSFDEDTLSMVAATGTRRLSRAIDLLLRAGIFERENSGYRFSHDKIRAVCYERLSGRLRKNYHARAAAILAEMPDVPIQRLAWHQFSASQWSLAASSWERAGDHAKAVHAYEEAFRAYQYAIKCVELEIRTVAEAADLKRIRLSFKSDEVLAVLGRPTDRRTILERVGALCHKAADPSLLMTLFIRKALLENHVGNFSAGVILARRAWSIARSENDLQGEVDALLVLALMLFRAERYRRSLAVSRLTLTKLGDGRSPFKVTALLNAASVYVMLGDYLPASTSLDEARSISIELGLRAEQCQVMTRRALLDKFAGNVRQSRMGFLEALELANESQDLVSATRIRAQLATLDALEGRLGDAIRRLRQAINASRNIGYFWTEVSCLNEVGYGVGRLLGNFKWAWDASDRALSLPGVFRSKYLSWMLRDSRALLLLEEARYDDAMTEIQEVLDLVEPLRAQPAFLESLARRGVVRLMLGDPVQAAADLESAREGQLRKGQRLLLPETLTYLAMAYGALGDAHRAIASSSEATQLLAEMSNANHQPQRIFLHHYKILEMFDRKPRLQYLKRAVEFIEAQASTLSKAQARRFRRDVCLNREILEAWERHKQEFQPEGRDETTTTSALAPVTPVSVSPVI